MIEIFLNDNSYQYLSYVKRVLSVKDVKLWRNDKERHIFVEIENRKEFSNLQVLNLLALAVSADTLSRWANTDTSIHLDRKGA